MTNNANNHIMMKYKIWLELIWEGEGACLL